MKAQPFSWRPGHVLASRQKGAVLWQARISTDRGRLEVVGLVPASDTATTIEPLTEPELRELLGESTDLHQDETAPGPGAAKVLPKESHPRVGGTRKPVRFRDENWVRR